MAPVILACATVSAAGSASVVFETTSAYHHIRVIDHGGMRTLCFDDAWESQIALNDPLKGHFEYTEYFHMPWLWNTNILNVLMIGLGGGTTQRSFAHYYPDVTVQSVEIDPMVARVARDYFQFQESNRQKIQVADGRVFLRRSTAKYDLIILDAYVQGRYGSCIPQHLATKEFFELARDHLTTNGIVAYNVIGALSDWQANLIGAIHRTLQTVFPQVYLFAASTEQNVILVATRAKGRADLIALRQRASLLVKNGQLKLPTFRTRLERLQPQAPLSSARSPVLTDDYAPVEHLAGLGGKAERRNPKDEER